MQHNTASTSGRGQRSDGATTATRLRSSSPSTGCGRRTPPRWAAAGAKRRTGRGRRAIPAPPTPSSRPSRRRSSCLQSPHHRGSRSTRECLEVLGRVPHSSVPSSSGKSLNAADLIRQHPRYLQSPHHREVAQRSHQWLRRFCRFFSVPSSSGKSLNSCRNVLVQRVIYTSVPSSSGKSLNPSTRTTRSTALSPFRPLIIGEVAQQHPSGSQSWRGFRWGLKTPLKPHTKTGHLSGPSRLRSMQNLLVRYGFSAWLKKVPGFWDRKSLFNRAAMRPLHPAPVRPIQRTAAPFRAPAGAATRPRGRARRPR
jgi:hypothetical protein